MEYNNETWYIMVILGPLWRKYLHTCDTLLKYDDDDDARWATQKMFTFV